MIAVRKLNKRFRLYQRPSDRLKEMLLRRSFHRTHVALADINFELAAGQALGVLGRNGAGKSTLLKLLTGVLQPDTGDIELEGRITGLLELGTGFDYDLSGTQNILTNGLLLGMTRSEIDERRADIIAFSELGEFVHEPVRTYSSGMVMRLAFSIAIHAEPSCFVVDEALSVGDAHFQQKCMRRIREYRQRGGSIIFVSHDLNAVKMLCDRALVLELGRKVFEGSPEDAVNHYNRVIAEEDDRRELESPERQQHSFGNRRVEILSADVVGAASSTDVVAAGEMLTISLHCRANEAVADMTAGFVVRDRFGQDIYGCNSFYLEQQLPMEKGQLSTIRFQFPAELAPAPYTVSAALHSQENHLENCYHWCDNISRFEVAGVNGAVFSGVCRLPTRIAVKTDD